MKVLLAKNSGFCDGVKRAIRTALSAAEKGKLSADGPLVHNDQALNLLSLRGIGILSGPAAVNAPDGGQVLIRAHGIAPERRRRWLEAGCRIIDATCVHVARNQRLVREAAARGETIVIAADPSHPETLAVAGEAGPRCRIVSSLAEIDALEKETAEEGIVLLAQTTFNAKLFGEMAAALTRRFPDCRIADSICQATRDRQDEAERLSAAADILVVVGGRHSANTRRLAEAGLAAGKPTRLVETAEDLRPGDFAAFRVAAVTAGASTPGWITQEVVNRLRRLGQPCPGDRLFRLAHFLIESRLSTALAAAGLALAAQQLLLTSPAPPLIIAGAGYVFFAHILNRRLPKNPAAARLSPIDSYYQARRGRLLLAAWLAAGAGLILAAGEGGAVFALFLSACIAAALYAVPASRTPAFIAKIRLAFNPHHWAMPAGWTLILAGPPAWEAQRLVPGLLVPLFIFLIRLGGTMVRDLHDIASDRLLGIDTLSSRLGPEPSKQLATVCLLGAALAPVAVLAITAWHGGASTAWLLSAAFIPAAPGLGLFLLELLRRRSLSDAILLQAGVDGICVLAGIPVIVASLAAWAQAC
ncbi:MAG: 4-hydroxy-3-methylbut-2-enyl diphosphate reductase [Planctomycetota bacterium]|nr:4-hydroxy-3-methylbut-2-enyl diphosphate reductase [Planctomycetota bacterium]